MFQLYFDLDFPTDGSASADNHLLVVMDLLRGHSLFGADEYGQPQKFDLSGRGYPIPNRLVVG